MYPMKVSINLDEAENRALIKMADLAYRSPREQLRWLLVQEARRLGLLPQASEHEMDRLPAAQLNESPMQAVG